MTDGKDPAVQSVEMTSRNCVTDSVPRVTVLFGELPDGDDPVLPLRTLRQRLRST